MPRFSAHGGDRGCGRLTIVKGGLPLRDPQAKRADQERSGDRHEITASERADPPHAAVSTGASGALSA
jgi:hypothetical protein